MSEPIKGPRPGSRVPREALEDAVKVIRTWHSMKLPKSSEAQIWAIYWKHAPEMKAIREALEA